MNQEPKAHPLASFFHSGSLAQIPILLAGSTAVGKSAIALVLAERIGGEIISVDSMQVYRGLDIGTDKPSASQRARVAHHLIDVRDLSQSFDAAQFVQLARQAMAEIQRRGRRPILCGGTGFYFKALLEGLGEAPPGDPTIRVQLEIRPLPELLQELAERDPALYSKIDRKNPRRIIRALEVIRLTGRPFSEQRGHGMQSDAEHLISAGDKAPLITLTRTPADLRARIDARVDEMFRRGLVAETQGLLDHGLTQNQTAMQALGYRQVVEHLRGKRSLEATIELVRIRTRQLAKRQMTWFRRQKPVVYFELAPGECPENSVERLLPQFDGLKTN
jgi:tRNA dimethylallyltransferase